MKYCLWDNVKRKMIYSHDLDFDFSVELNWENKEKDDNEFFSTIKRLIGSKKCLGRKISFINEQLLDNIVNQDIYNYDIVEFSESLPNDWIQYYGYDKKLLNKYVGRRAIVKALHRADNISYKMIFLDNNEKIYISLEESEFTHPCISIDRLCHAIEYDEYLKKEAYDKKVSESRYKYFKRNGFFPLTNNY